ncbi:site-specific integrase [Jiangella anatolica]|uniref:Site-specific integrase n=1 Tax=Jiangella anatolica TaxID=2670374 RepID=A0A2W2B2P0_9ACTN|nr:site-specific integrase [Jiangella anatolica]PZF81595.1 site-specific integrase [Jiangella anatolica]
MGRAPLPIGTWGKIRTYVDKTDAKGKPIRHRAIAQFREFDGRTRPVEAHGKTPTAAANALREKLTVRAKAGRTGDLTALHRCSDAIDLYLAKFKERVEAGKRSAGTLELYERHIKNHVRPALGEVRLGEISTPLLDKIIAKIKKQSGAATAKTCRSIISGVMKLVVRYGVMAVNPVREVDSIEAEPKNPPRALTEAELTMWLDTLRSEPIAMRWDLPDLTTFMLATGCRIGEALAVMWEQIDLEAGTVELTHTVIRLTGIGLIRKKTKTSAGERLLQLPLFGIVMLRRRFAEGIRLDQPVFASTVGGLRDPSNVRKVLRQVRGDGALAWITSHAFRKTTATVLDDAGQSARQVADQLGHSRPSMTQDVYMARRVLNPTAAGLLDDALLAKVAENHG